MKAINVNFKVQISNPIYRYGDLNETPYKTLEGTGDIVEFIEIEKEVKAIVAADDKKLYLVRLDNITTNYWGQS